MNSVKTYVVAITGASGTIYGIRLMKALIEQGHQVMALISSAGRKVMDHEMGSDPKSGLYEILEAYGVDFSKGALLDVFDDSQIAAPPASGSFIHDGMAVTPCSMKTLSAVSAGYADNLISRSADVCLKEKRPLILVPRETPLNLIHLENMTRVTRAGGVILPPSPSFYTFPDSMEALVDTVTARILDHLGAGTDLLPRWGGEA